mmetsp:Transcript_35235/g.49077  ORF Transcript_35235/g.49077 Transcript_35235/m.49077 type:complete len:115 (+) Transcript_35235:445-789(+)
MTMAGRRRKKKNQRRRNAREVAIEETEMIATKMTKTEMMAVEAVAAVRETATAAAAAVIIAMKRGMRTEIRIGEKEGGEAAAREMTKTTISEEGTVIVMAGMTVTDAGADDLQE